MSIHIIVMSTTDLYLQTPQFYLEEPICPIPLSQALFPTIMQSTLQILSTEIVEIVAGNLQPLELYSLRLVCRDLYKKSLGIFARLLNTIKTDLSAPSLQKLVAISNSAHLAPHIRNLHIRADKEGYRGRGFEWSRNTSRGLMDPLPGVSSMLQEILINKLINCRSFRIDIYDDVCMQKKSARVTPGDVLSIVYFIVVNANLQIKSLKVEGRDEIPVQLSTERLLSLYLHREKGSREGLSSWISLDSFILRFDLTMGQYDWALNILKEASALRRLSLRLDFGDNFFPRLAALGPFHAIENRSLTCMTLNGTSLSLFLIQHGNTLRDLTLRYLHLKPDSVEEEAATSWETVFGDMIGHMDRLEQICVLSLSEPHSYLDRARARIVFPSLSVDDRYPVVPGSKERTTGNGFVRADARVVATLESPVKPIYKFYGGQQRTLGVAYEGRQIDEFLALLIKAKEVYV